MGVRVSPILKISRVYIKDLQKTLPTKDTRYFPNQEPCDPRVAAVGRNHETSRPDGAVIYRAAPRWVLHHLCDAAMLLGRTGEGEGRGGERVWGRNLRTEGPFSVLASARTIEREPKRRWAAAMQRLARLWAWKKDCLYMSTELYIIYKQWTKYIYIYLYINNIYLYISHKEWCMAEGTRTQNFILGSSRAFRVAKNRESQPCNYYSFSHYAISYTRKSY